jgi:hypothetical protein
LVTRWFVMIIFVDKKYHLIIGIWNDELISNWTSYIGFLIFTLVIAGSGWQSRSMLEIVT